MAVGLPWGVDLTIEDLEEMPEDGHRYELVDGMLLVTPAPGAGHQSCVVVLAATLLSAAGPDDVVLVAPFDYVVDAQTVFQTDLLVVARADVGTRRLERTPRLVVEIQSPSTRLTDLTLKRAAYEAAGVDTYWLVDPTKPELTVLRLAGGVYVETDRVGGDDPYVADYPFAVTVVPRTLLRGLTP
ncbi:MAG: Uma2 family endonuclease [Acidimicrobiales bacterium]